MPTRVHSRQHRQPGFTLIELIIFIVILGVGLAGIISVFNVTVRSSVDPLVRKQLLAIAEALTEEINLQPVTYCDPDDGNVYFACASTGTCTGSATPNCTTAEGLGPELGETRYSSTTRFDNVNDYHGFSMSPIRDLNNSLVTGLDDYSASVAVSGSDPLVITVTVSRGSQSFTLTSFRYRYNPNGTG